MFRALGKLKESGSESVLEPRVVEVDPRLRAMYEDAKRLVGIMGGSILSLGGAAVSTQKQKNSDYN